MKENTPKRHTSDEAHNVDMVRITVKDMDLPDPVAELIRERAARLRRYYPRLQLCLVTAEGPGSHHRTGGPYRIQIEMRVPRHEPLVVSRQQDEDLSHAVKESFEAAKRRLTHFAELSRGEGRKRSEKLVNVLASM